MKQRERKEIRAQVRRIWELSPRCAMKIFRDSRKPDMMKRMERKRQNDRICNQGLTEQMLEQLRILADVPHLRHLVERVARCSDRYPCRSKWCPICADPKLRGTAARHSMGCKLNNGECNLVAPMRGLRSGAYAVSAGYRMTRPFKSIPNQDIHFVTINLALIPITGDLEAATAQYRRRVRKVLMQMGENVIARGKFDMALKLASDLNFTLPEEDCPANFSGQPFPAERVGMLHIHLTIFAPERSEDQMKALFKGAFPGKRRVCVRDTKDDIVT